LHHLKRDKESEVEYRKAIALYPNLPEAHNNLGVLLHDLKRYGDAEESYRNAIELDPDYATAQKNLSILLRDFKEKRSDPSDGGASPDIRQSERPQGPLSPGADPLGFNTKDIDTDNISEDRLRDLAYTIRSSVETEKIFLFNLTTISPLFATALFLVSLDTLTWVILFIMHILSIYIVHLRDVYSHPKKLYFRTPTNKDKLKLAPIRFVPVEFGKNIDQIRGTEPLTDFLERFFGIHPTEHPEDIDDEEFIEKAYKIVRGRLSWKSFQYNFLPFLITVPALHILRMIPVGLFLSWWFLILLFYVLSHYAAGAISIKLHRHLNKTVRTGHPLGLIRKPSTLERVLEERGVGNQVSLGRAKWVSLKHLPPQLRERRDEVIASLDESDRILLFAYLKGKGAPFVKDNTSLWVGDDSPASLGMSITDEEVVANRNLLIGNLRFKGGGTRRPKGDGPFLIHENAAESLLTHVLHGGGNLPTLLTETRNSLAFLHLYRSVWETDELAANVSLGLKEITHVPDGRTIEEFFMSLLKDHPDSEGKSIREFTDKNSDKIISEQPTINLSETERLHYARAFIEIIRPAQMVDVNQAPVRLQHIHELLSQHETFIPAYLKIRGVESETLEFQWDTVRQLTDNIFSGILINYTPPDPALDNGLSLLNNFVRYKEEVLKENRKSLNKFFHDVIESVGRSVGTLWTVGGSSEGESTAIRNIGVRKNRGILHDMDNTYLPNTETRKFNEDLFAGQMFTDLWELIGSVEILAKSLDITGTMKKEVIFTDLPEVILEAIDQTFEMIFANRDQDVLNDEYIQNFLDWAQKPKAWAEPTGLFERVLQRIHENAIALEDSAKPIVLEKVLEERGVGNQVSLGRAKTYPFHQHLPKPLRDRRDGIIKSLDKNDRTLLFAYLKGKRVPFVNIDTPLFDGSHSPIFRGLSASLELVEANRNLVIGNLRFKGGGTLRPDVNGPYSIFEDWQDSPITTVLYGGGNSPALLTEAENTLAYLHLYRSVWETDELPGNIILGIKAVSHTPDGQNLEEYFVSLMKDHPESQGKALREFMDKNSKKQISSLPIEDFSDTERRRYARAFIKLIDPTQYVDLNHAPVRMREVTHLLDDYENFIPAYIKLLGLENDPPQEQWEAVRQLTDNIFLEILNDYAPPDPAFHQDLSLLKNFARYKEDIFKNNRETINYFYQEIATDLLEKLGTLWAVGGASDGEITQLRNIGLRKHKAILQDMDHTYLPHIGTTEFDGKQFIIHMLYDITNFQKSFATLGSALKIPNPIQFQVDWTLPHEATLRAANKTFEKVFENPDQNVLNQEYIQKFLDWARNYEDHQAAHKGQMKILALEFPRQIKTKAIALEALAKPPAAEKEVGLPAGGAELSLFKHEFYRRYLAGLESIPFGVIALGFPGLGLLYAIGFYGSGFNLLLTSLMVPLVILGLLINKPFFVGLHELPNGEDYEILEWLKAKNQAVDQLRTVFYASFVVFNLARVALGWNLWTPLLLSGLILVVAHYINDWIFQWEENHPHEMHPVLQFFGLVFQNVFRAELGLSGLSLKDEHSSPSHSGPISYNHNPKTGVYEFEIEYSDTDWTAEFLRVRNIVKKHAETFLSLNKDIKMNPAALSELLRHPAQNIIHIPGKKMTFTLQREQDQDGFWLNITTTDRGAGFSIPIELAMIGGFSTFDRVIEAEEGYGFSELKQALFDLSHSNRLTIDTRRKKAYIGQKFKSHKNKKIELKRSQRMTWTTGGIKRWEEPSKRKTLGTTIEQRINLTDLNDSGFMELLDDPGIRDLMSDDMLAEVKRRFENLFLKNGASSHSNYKRSMTPGLFPFWYWMTKNLPNEWRSWGTVILGGLGQGMAVWLLGTWGGWSSDIFKKILVAIILNYMIIGYLVWDYDKNNWRTIWSLNLKSSDLDLSLRSQILSTVLTSSILLAFIPAYHPHLIPFFMGHPLFLAIVPNLFFNTTVLLINSGLFYQFSGLEERKYRRMGWSKPDRLRAKKMLPSNRRLLRWVFANLTPRDLMKFQKIREEMEKVNFKIPKSMAEYSNFIIDRLAFQMTFLDVPLPLTPFSLDWYQTPQEIDSSSVISTGGTKQMDKFGYAAAMIFPEGFFKDHAISDFDSGVMSEVLHVSQFYLSDISNEEKPEGIILASKAEGFLEVGEFMMKRLKGWQEGFVSTLTEIDPSFQTPSHLSGQDMGIKAFQRIETWIRDGRITRKDLSIYVRAYIRLFNLVNLSPLMKTFKWPLSRMSYTAGFLSWTIQSSDWEERDAASILKDVLKEFNPENIEASMGGDNLSNLRAIGFEVDPLRQWAQNSMKINFDSPKAQEQARQALTDLYSIVSPISDINAQIRQEEESYMDQQEDKILSITNPAELLRKAQMTSLIGSDQDKERFGKQQTENFDTTGLWTLLPNVSLRNAVKHIGWKWEGLMTLGLFGLTLPVLFLLEINLLTPVSLWGYDVPIWILVALLSLQPYAISHVLSRIRQTKGGELETHGALKFNQSRSPPWEWSWTYLRYLASGSLYYLPFMIVVAYYSPLHPFAFSLLGLLALGWAFGAHLFNNNLFSRKSSIEVAANRVVEGIRNYDWIPYLAGMAFLLPANQLNWSDIPFLAVATVIVGSTKGRRKKYPSQEAVETALKEREEKGWANNPQVLQRGDHPDRALYLAAQEFRVPLPKKGKKYPTKEAVETALKEREEKGWANNPGALGQGNHPDWALYSTAQDFQVPLPEGKGREKIYPTKEAVETALKEREEKGWANNPRALGQGNHPDRALYNTAREFQVPLPKKGKKYPTKEAAETTLKEREEKGWANNPEALKKGDHPDAVLYLAAQEFQVPLPKGKGREKKYPTQEAVEKALKEREEKGWANNPRALQHGDHPDQALYNSAREFQVPLPKKTPSSNKENDGPSFFDWASQFKGGSLKESVQQLSRQWGFPVQQVRSVLHNLDIHFPENETKNPGTRNDQDFNTTGLWTLLPRVSKYHAVKYLGWSGEGVVTLLLFGLTFYFWSWALAALLALQPYAISHVLSRIRQTKGGGLETHGALKFNQSRSPPWAWPWIYLRYLASGSLYYLPFIIVVATTSSFSPIWLNL